MLRSLRIASMIFCFFSLVALAGLAGKVQETFDDPDGKYSVTLPKGWLAVTNKDRLSGKTDFLIVYGIRENGALKVTTMDVEAKLPMSDVALKHEAETLRFQPGYTKGKVENFVVGPQASGSLITYDFKNTAGQPLIGRNYFLRANDTTVYVLRFTGRANTLGSLRNQTDAIARSFKLK